LQILEDSGKQFEIIKYIEDVPSEAELRKILKLLDLKPIQLVRKKEPLWKENFADKDLNDEETIKTMIKNPRLIERPIIIDGKKAVIGRPPESIKSLF